jgi:putative chitinase
LNYSAKALNTVFPKYFTRAGRSAEEYARNPEKIANVVYANRMGNGDIASADGWRYRGRGPIQLTGRSNYAAFGTAFGVDVLKNPDLVQTNKEIGLMAAVWFWNKNGLNELADAQDIKAMTKRINGGYNGLEDRIALYKHVMVKMDQG